MHGYGVYTWPDGRQYEGQYVMNKRHGVGIYVTREGLCYEGEWKNGMQHGEGKITYANGHV